MHNHLARITVLMVLSALTIGALGPAAPIMAAGEWYAEYFSNATLAGGPVLTRYEADLTHEWGFGSPGPGVPADGFSARFVKDIWFEAGTYRFRYRSDDGLRLWINGQLIIDAWQDQSATWHSCDHAIPGGVQQVRIEYYEHSGVATLQVGWEKLQGGDAWEVSFWGNTKLSGPALVGRRDPAIDFDWGTGSPDPKVPGDGFSARWARTLGFEAGTYRFYASSDDGVRIYIDGQAIVDAWVKQKLPNTHHGDITLGAGQHTVVVDYFEEGGEAAIHVWWDRLDAVSGWEGRYYDNRELRGGPALIRADREIAFDWGEGAPVDWMPADNFSVQWIRTLDFAPGLYRFNARADDGIRLWIDDVDLRLNYWEPQDSVWHYQDWHWLQGSHTLRVEYFEGTGVARVQFWWDYAPTVEAARAISPSPIYHTPATSIAPVMAKKATVESTLHGPWRAEYFAGRDMGKEPRLVRTDPTIDFDWGWDAPAEGIPANVFAVRWTGSFTFSGGCYRFITTTDDGFRLYIDDRLVLSNWRPMRGRRSIVVRLDAGTHVVRMEYFEALQAAKAKLTWQRIGP